MVGHLYRRITAPLTVSDGEDDVELAAGTLVDLDLRAINADAEILGESRCGSASPGTCRAGSPTR